MDIHAIYSQIEDKYYAFLDSLDARGIPIYKLVDPLENAGIPSLPIFVGGLIVLLAIVAYMLTSGTAGVQAFVVDSEGLEVEGALVTAEWGDDGYIDALTDAEGKAILDVPAGREITFTVSNEGCETTAETYGEPPEDLSITINCMVAPDVAACLQISEDMESTYLIDPDGYPAKGCVVRIHPAWDQTRAYNVKWKVDASGTLLITDPVEECPQESDTIEIDCEGHKYSASLSSFLNDVKLHNTITLIPKEPVPDPIPDGIADDDLVHLPQHIENKYAIPLEGVRVLATDEDGHPFDFVGFDNVVTECTTDSNGDCELILPKGQEFMITTHDPQGAYHAVDDPTKYTADEDDVFDVNELVAQEGFETNIHVKEKDRQNPVIGATVEITRNGKHIGYPVYTNSLGKVTVVLLKDTTYDLVVRHPQYERVVMNVTGDEDTTTYMEKVDVTLTGDLAILVSNEHRTKDPLYNVRVKLVDDNGTIYTMGISNPAGEIYFSNIMPGTYQVYALPDSGYSYQAEGEVIVTSQNITRLNLGVLPKQVRLTIYPLIEIRPDATYDDERFVRKEGVRVEVWNAYYEELDAVKITGEERKIWFDVDFKTELYFVITFEESGMKYGPRVSTRETYYSDAEEYIKVYEQPEDVEIRFDILDTGGTSLSSSPNLNPGWPYYAQLLVELPEYSVETPYENTEIEFFVGDPGELRNTQQTPIVITDMELNDIALEDPFVASLFKANNYAYGTDPQSDDEGLSKYIKVVIGDYTPSQTYEIWVPLNVRDLAREGSTSFSYRATWITPDGVEVYSNGGQWTTVNKFSINKPGVLTDFNDLREGPFYAYQHWVSQDKNGTSLKTKIQASQNAYFYYLITAKAREPVTDWEIPLDIVPGKAKPIAYEGWIQRAAGEVDDVTEITQQAMSGSTVRNTGGLYSLNRDDELALLITFLAEEPGTGSIIAFKDVDHPRSYVVAETPALQKETPVSGVTAKLTTAALFCEDDVNQYLGDQAGGFPCYAADYDPAEDTLPVNGKNFYLTFMLENSGLELGAFGADKSMNLKLISTDKKITFDKVWVNTGLTSDESDGLGTYVQEIPFTMPFLGAVVMVQGKGSTGASAGSIDAYIWEQGTPTPTDPWTTVTTGAVDYEIEVYPYTGGTVQQAISSESTDELRFKLYRTTNRQEEQLDQQGWLVNDLVKIAGVGSARWVSDGYYQYSVPYSKPITSELLQFNASSNKFGDIGFTDDLSYLEFEPEYPRQIYGTEPILYGSNEVTLGPAIYITNHYDEGVTITVEQPEREGWGLDAWAQLTEYILLETGEYGWVVVETYEDGIEGIEIPRDLRLAIQVDAKPTSVSCANEGDAYIVIESDKLRKDVVYSLDFSCKLLGEQYEPGVYSEVKAFVAREPTEPEAIDRYSCMARDETNYLCDAHQISMAILDAANYLAGNDDLVEIGFQYAVGNEEVGVAILKEAMDTKNFEHLGHIVVDEEAAALTDSKDIVMPDEVGCGVNYVSMVKNNDSDVVISVEEVLRKTHADLYSAGAASWCYRVNTEIEVPDDYEAPDTEEEDPIIDDPEAGTGFATASEGMQLIPVKADAFYLMGLMNFDRELRPTYGDYFSFDQGGENEKFIEAMQKSRELGNEISEALFFGYGAERLTPSTITKSRVGGQAQTFFKWKECSLSQSTNCPKWAVDDMREADVNVLGYLNIDQHNDVQVGLIYDPSKISTTKEGGQQFSQLDSYRTAFVTRILQYAMYGELRTITNPDDEEDSDVGGWYINSKNVRMSYLPEKDDQSDIITLVPPIIDEDGTAMYGIDYFGLENENLTGSSNVYLQIRVDDADYCAYGNINPDGSMGEETQSANFRIVDVIEDDTDLVLDEEHTLLPGDGLRRVGVYCVKNGVASLLEVKEIIVDESGLELLGYYPEIITIEDPVEDMPLVKVRDRFSEAIGCWIEGGENPLGTEGMLDAKSASMGQICGNNIDENSFAAFGYEEAAGFYLNDGCCDLVPEEAVDECTSVTVESVCGSADWTCIKNTCVRKCTTNRDCAANEQCVGADETEEKSGLCESFATVTDFFEVSTWKCKTPFILSSNQAFEGEIWCRDSLGHASKVADTSFYRWSDDAPQFSLVKGFVFGVQDADEVDYKQFLFDKALTTNADDNYVTKPFKTVDTAGDFKLVDTGIYTNKKTPEIWLFPENLEADSFRIELEVTDEDGISVCGIKNAHASLGDITNNECTTSITTAATATEPAIVKAKCKTFLKEGINQIGITCVDKTGTSRTESVSITRDQTGPEATGTIETDAALGELKAGGRVFRPKATVTVQDDYAEIMDCGIKIVYFPIDSYPEAADFENDEKYSATFDCTQASYEDGGLKKKYECKPNSDVMPSYLDRAPDSMIVECTDKIGNTRITTDTGPPLPTPEIDQMIDDVVHMCEVIRYHYDPSELTDFGYTDMGILNWQDGHGGLYDEDGKPLKIVASEEDDRDGSPTTVDLLDAWTDDQSIIGEIGSAIFGDGDTYAEIDSAGIMLVMHYSGDGSVTKKKLLDALRARENEWGVMRSADCLKQGLCQTALSIVGAKLLSKGATKLIGSKADDAAKVVTDGAVTNSKRTVSKGARKAMGKMNKKFVKENMEGTLKEATEAVSKQKSTFKNAMKNVDTVKGFKKTAVEAGMVTTKRADELAKLGMKNSDELAAKIAKSAGDEGIYTTSMKQSLMEAGVSQQTRKSVKGALRGGHLIKSVDGKLVKATGKELAAERSKEVAKIINKEVTKRTIRKGVDQGLDASLKTSFVGKIVNVVISKGMFKAWKVYIFEQVLLNAAEGLGHNLWQDDVNMMAGMMNREIEVANAEADVDAESYRLTGAGSCDATTSWTLGDKAELVPVIGDWIKMAIPSPLIGSVCSPQTMGPGSYVLVASGSKINIEGIASSSGEGIQEVGLSAMGACFDSCDKWMCTVTIYPIETQQVGEESGE